MTLPEATKSINVLVKFNVIPKGGDKSLVTLSSSKGDMLRQAQRDFFMS